MRRMVKSSHNVIVNIALRIRSLVERQCQSRIAQRYPAQRGNRKIVLPVEQPADLCRSQNAHFPLRRDMAGEEWEGSLASEIQVSAKYMLLWTLSHITGRQGENPERHQQGDYGMKALQIVLQVASKVAKHMKRDIKEADEGR